MQKDIEAGSGSADASAMEADDRLLAEPEEEKPEPPDNFDEEKERQKVKIKIKNVTNVKGEFRFYCRLRIMLVRAAVPRGRRSSIWSCTRIRY